MKVVLDTNILVRAANGFASPAFDLLMAITAPPNALLLSAFQLEEVGRAMRYPRVRAVHGLSDEGVAIFLDNLLNASRLIDVPDGPAESQVADDPDDNAIVALAVAGQAAVLCTRDRHLKTEKVVSYLLREGVEVLSDLELLSRLRS